jgi:hypothetical protein
MIFCLDALTDLRSHALLPCFCPVQLAGWAIGKVIGKGVSSSNEEVGTHAIRMCHNSSEHQLLHTKQLKNGK